MTTYNKATLKTFFAQNDIPQGSDFANFIDSYVNLVETAEQAMAGPIYTTKMITPIISAAAVNVTALLRTTAFQSFASTFTGTTSAAGINVTGVVSADTVVVNGNMKSDTGTFLSRVSAQSGITVIGAVSATGGIYCSSVLINSISIISAAGTAQATGATLIATFNRLQGITNDQATGFVIPANQQGLVQYIVNETNVSANLWPPTGGKINNLATNAAFAIAAGGSNVIFHTDVSAYGVR